MVYHINRLDRLQDKAIRHLEYCFDKKRRKEIDVLQVEFNIEPLSSKEEEKACENCT